MVTIAVCSGKGGAGKTVFTAALATMLAELGKKVLLVDADYSVAGLTYLAGRTDGFVDGFTFSSIFADDAQGEMEKLLGIRDRPISVIPTRTDSSLPGAGRLAGLPLEQIQGAYCEFLHRCELEPYLVDYVIADTRAGFDSVSAGIALSSNRVIVLMEQDRVSYRSSHAFVTDVIALGKSRDMVSVPEPADYYYLPNKVSPGYAQALRRMRVDMPGNILSGIPLDLNFFHRYFRDIFNYSLQGRYWRRTSFYRHLRNSMSDVFRDLSRVRHSVLAEIRDTVSFMFFLWSPKVTVLLILVFLYTLLTYVYLLSLVGG